MLGQSKTLEEMLEGRHDSTRHFGPLFATDHLPAHLKDISKEFADVFRIMLKELPDGPEFSAGVRKLLEAKDCFVRAQVLESTKAL